MEVYFSDADLTRIGYYKEGLVWFIAGQKYRVKQAVRDGIYFIQI